MLDDAFAHLVPDAPRFYPIDLRPGIDAWNERIGRGLNNGVYRAGFATSQTAYDEAVATVFETLDMIEVRLADARYLCGDIQTLADWRLFPTLVRFDVGYFGAFKCNLRRITDYPCLWAYARDLYQTPGVAETVDLPLYRQGYFSPTALRNPHGIVPVGPAPDFTAPHQRDGAIFQVRPPM